MTKSPERSIRKTHVFIALAVVLAAVCFVGGIFLWLVPSLEGVLAAIQRHPVAFAAVVSGLALVGAAIIASQALRIGRKQQRSWDEREELLSRLERKQEQYRSLVDNITLGVMRVDRELNVIAANKTFRAWFPSIVPGTGQRSVEIFGVGPSDPLPEDCPVLQTLVDGGVHAVNRKVKVGLEFRHLRVVTSPVTDSNGEIIFVIITLEDVTEHLARDRELEAAEAKYRGIFENAVEGIYQTALTGELLSANPAAARVLGYDTPQEFMDDINIRARELYVKPARRKEFLNLLKKDGYVNEFESEVYTRDGEAIWIKENARVTRDEDGNLAHIDGILLDITKRKKAEQALERQRIFFQELFESSPLGIVLANERGEIIKVNGGFEDLFGYEAHEVVGKRPIDIVVPEAKFNESYAMTRAIESGKSVSKETVRKHADESVIPMQVVGYPVTIDGRTAGAYYLYQNIAERKEFERQLSHQAFHDALTALPNRTLYMERLSRAVQRGSRRDGYHFAAMMIDLDRFKRVNDTLGHLIGDQLLVGVALRILSCIRTVDTVARLGGDEFAILLEEFENSREVIQVANRIRDMLSEPFHVDGHEVQTGASIGIVLKTGAYERAEDILRDADIAMYQCKERHRDRLVFNKRMHEAVMEETRLEEELRLALEQDQLVLHYQPIVKVGTQDLQGFEALVRWRHPRRGLLMPLEFISFAEETGLIVPLGRWVIAEACSQMASWCDARDERWTLGVSVSVNISAKQFVQPDLVEFIEEQLRKHALEPSRLKLEITETVLMDEARQARHKLDRLKALGVQIMVDDFGTGYSSLSYLQQFPVDYLKIDKTFISGEGNEKENREIVNTIILLARSLGLKVVAEGVEDAGHLAMLQDLDCDDAQGFMFSKPVAKAEAKDILQQFMEVLRSR